MNEGELADRIGEGLQSRTVAMQESPTARQLHAALATFIERRPR
jgi:hypothetical protein